MEKYKEKVESLLRKLELLDDGEKYDGHLDEWITENTDRNGETWIWYLDNECEGFLREKDNKIVIPHDKEESDEMARNFYIDDHEDEEEIEKEKIKNIMNKIDEEFKNTNINNNDEEEDER